MPLSMLLLAKAAAVCYSIIGGNLDAKGVKAVRTALLKWRSSLPWVLLACLALGAAMAAYTWTQEKDFYRAVYTFCAQPGQDAAQNAPGEAARMLAQDCHALTRTEGFRSSVLAGTASDGMTRVGVRGVNGTHMLEVVAEGPDPEATASLANAVGRALLGSAVSELGASDAREIAPASIPDAPSGPDRPRKVLWTMLAVFVAGSLLGCLLGCAERPLHFDDPEAGALNTPVLGALPDCRREARRMLSARKRHDGMLLDKVDRLIRENVRVIALRLRNAMCAGGCGVAVIAGVDRKDDQAVLTALLCGELARQGFRVLAVEMDEGTAQLAPLLGVRGRASLEEYLTGRAPLMDAIVRCPEPNLCYLSGLTMGGEVADMAATPAFRSFFKSACSRFDFVILNAAGMKNCADAAMLGAMESVTVLAAGDGRFSARELNAAIGGLSGDVRLVRGVAFTMANRDRFDALR